MSELLVVTSLNVSDEVSELPSAIRSALEAHAAECSVREVHILTEADKHLVTRLILQVLPRIMFKVFQTNKRPTLAVLFEHASNCIAANGGRAAIMNADVSFAGNADISRCLDSLKSFSGASEQPIYALTRHDFSGGTWAISLFEGCGLPNMLSTDCWIISNPVYLETADFYSLGEMNCDLMLNYDLIAAGHEVYNPCLNVCTQHHEIDTKTNKYYLEHSRSVGTLERLSRFMELRHNSCYLHYGVPWVSTEWLISGYRPAPYSNRTKKLVVRVSDSQPVQLPSRLEDIEGFAIRNSFDLILLADGSPESLFKACQKLLTGNSRIYILKLCVPFRLFFDQLLAEGKDNHQGLCFASNAAYLSDELASISDFIIIDEKLQLRDHSVYAETQIKGVLHPGKSELCRVSECGHDSNEIPQVDLGNRCTLVTSVFKSDEFLRKFTANSLSLEGYGERIDHIFLVSETSAEERRVLINHFDTCDNVLLVRNNTDPGLYSCWRLGIRLARTLYVSNANVDDLRSPAHVLKLTAILDVKAHIDVACSAIVPFHEHTGILPQPGERQSWFSNEGGEFGYFELGSLQLDADSRSILKPHNLPHCMPVWRKALHETHGFFDEERYGTFADWAFWLAVTKEGGRGYLLPEPLAHYYINSTSHNRRGDKLHEFHRKIEEENIGQFAAMDAWLGNRPIERLKPKGRVVRKKLNLGINRVEYGNHRHSFDSLVESLRPLHLGAGGITFLPFIESYFVWGATGNEACSKNPQPVSREWLGILHVPFDSPQWFAKAQRPEAIFESNLWQRSFPLCRGLICLSEDLQADLNVYYPDLPTLALKFPTDLRARHFDYLKYSRQPRVVQVGDWLRHLQAIYRIKATGHRKLMLRKRSTLKSLEREIEEIGNFTNKSVLVKDFVSNEAYDEILSTSVVLCFLYATAANNLLLECIARHTPIIINPLPSVVEYLGDQYPLYASTIEMADALLMDRKRIREASEYLQLRAATIDLSYRGFQETIAASDLYEAL